MLLTLLASAFLSACDHFDDKYARAEKACSAYVIEKLKAPSTFNLRKATHSIDALSKAQYLAVSDEGALGKEAEQFVDTLPHTGLHTVVLEYEAENSFGAPIKSLDICRFAMVDTSNGKYLREDLKSLAESHASREQLSALTKELSGQSADNVSGCCLRAGADIGAIGNTKNLEVKVNDHNA